jgi:hypothetical protein
MLISANGVAVVVDGDDAYAGTIDLEAITAAIREMRAEALDTDAAGTSGQDVR